MPLAAQLTRAWQKHFKQQCLTQGMSHAQLTDLGLLGAQHDQAAKGAADLMPSSNEAPCQELSKFSETNNADPEMLLRLHLALGSRFKVKGHGSVQG